MMRREGEQAVPRTLLAIVPMSPVERVIAAGDTRLHTWLCQQRMAQVGLARTTVRTVARFQAIERGDRVSHAEIHALARACSVSTEALIGPLPDRSPVID